MTWRRRRNKYGNQTKLPPCKYGYKHRSMLELAVCEQVWLREQAKELQHIRHEVSVYLSEARHRYIADFKVLDLKTGQEKFIEAKGYEGGRWKDSLRLYRVYGPAPLEIWKGHWRHPVHTETVIPKQIEEKK